MRSKNVLPIWQPVGFSTHLISQRVAEKLNTKTSHTGTLDPMAEGVIIVLKGKERLRKKEYAKWQKVYNFEIVFGVSTDSLDSLGLIESTSLVEINKNKLLKVVQNLVGEYEQIIPKFSTKKVKGKHLHEYAREGKEINLPPKKGRIHNLELNSFRKERTEIIIKNQLDKIKKVRGDFRKGRVVAGWQRFISEAKNPRFLYKAEFEAKTSKGIYIRSLARDICNELGTIGFTSSIIRTQNGKYIQKDCKNLHELFTKSELEGDYFLSRP